MTFDQLYKEIENCAGMLDMSKLKGKHGVYLLDITGEGGGKMYAELADGKLAFSRTEISKPDCTARVSAENVQAMLEGKLNPILALTLRKIKVSGDLSSLMMFKELLK